MYDHIGLRVADLDASVRFYTAALAPLGFELCSRDETGAGFGPKGGPALWLHLHKDEAGTGASSGRWRGRSDAVRAPGDGSGSVQSSKSRLLRRRGASRRTLGRSEYVRSSSSFVTYPSSSHSSSSSSAMPK